MIAPSESLFLDGLARYIGETFRRAIGGKWEIRLDDPKYVFYDVPQLTGFSPTPTPVCPSGLATASADRRSGQFIRGVLENHLRRGESCLRDKEGERSSQPSSGQRGGVLPAGVRSSREVFGNA